LAKRDYYEILGVSQGASQDEIKKAYRQLARKHHPDVSKEEDAEERFKEINEAYKVLSDPEQRQKYDQFGHAAFEEAGMGQGGFGGFGGGFGGFDDLGDIFDTFFGGGGGGRPRARQGADLRADLTIEFEDAAFGKKQTITVNRVVVCEHCHGNKAEPGTPIKNCPDCGGAGKIQGVQQTPFGRMNVSRTCSRCHGEGKIHETPCKECNGQGRLRKPEKIEVDIPAGIDDGQVLRIGGKGDAGDLGGPPGDLNIVIRVRPHKVFTRRNNDVLCTVPITIVQAALGDEIEMPTLEGPVNMRIPEGTQSGKTMRLRGKGIRDVRGHGRGDQLVTIHVETPTKLTERQKELLREFAKERGETHPEESRSFFDRVKDALR